MNDVTRHLFECCVCKHEMQLRESLYMQMGGNRGHGKCLSCKTFLCFALKNDGKVKVRTMEQFEKILTRVHRATG